MQFVFLATGVITIILLILIIVRQSEKTDDSKSRILEDISRQLASSEESLRRIEQALTVTSTRLDGLDKRSSQLNTLVDSRLAQFSTDNDKLTKTVEGKLSEIQKDNEKRLEQMRQTVEEKLQTTLESRLSTSFKQVGDQLESVYKQLGEMQVLAQGVGNLEKVLTNVKARGMWGELQAERILQEILLPEQYLKTSSPSAQAVTPLSSQSGSPEHTKASMCSCP